MTESRRLRSLVLFTAAVAVGGVAAGHIRILHPSTAAGLHWSVPGAIGIVIQSDGSDNIADASDEVAIRNGIQAWNAVTGSGANLIEDTNPAVQARTDWAADDIHLIYFDETGSSGYFPGSSGVVALTPLWFFSDGRISDADILFNGKNFQFTTTGESGRFDVQDVVTHELGHFLGLDHSGFAGATMYPYVDPTVILHRSLSLDDRNGARAVYPAGSFAALSGRVERSEGAGVIRAHVVAVDADGRTAGAALADANGNFTIGGLDAGSYRVYADPLDNPVSAANLTGSYSVQTNFETTFQAGTFNVSTGQNLSIGALVVDEDVALQLGRSADRLPRRATIGETTVHTLRGTGLSAGSTLVASDPDVTVSGISWFGSLVTFSVTVPGGEAPGHVDLTVTNGSGQIDVLAAGLELAPPDPDPTSLSSPSGTLSGGDVLTITGDHFRPGARVVIGDQIYVDGAPGGAVVVDENTITLTTTATVGGLHDVVVIDATGVEGRIADAYQVTGTPTPSMVFPSTVDVAGGTEVTISGLDFVEGAEVYFGATAASVVDVVSATQIDAVAPAGIVGPVTLSVVNPGGLTGNTSFAYVSQADPSISSVAPGVGSSNGGEAITITGTNFTSDAQVRFGVSTVDGMGGQAGSVTFIDPTTLRVVTPPGSGTVAVLVEDGSTGQAAVLAAAYVYSPAPSSDGGGCLAIGAPGPGSPWGILAGSAWIALLLAVGILRAWFATRQRTALAPDRPRP